MKKTSPTLSVIVFLTLQLFFALNVRAESLCSDKEEVYFSCAIKSKVVSICATADLSVTSGHLIYRFGKLNERPELEYPVSESPPQEAFSFAYRTYAKGTTIQLTFDVEEYTYTLDLQTHVYRTQWSGIVVEKEGKQFALLKCNTHTRGFELAKLKKLGFQVNEPRYFGTSTP